MAAAGPWTTVRVGSGGEWERDYVSRKSKKKKLNKVRILLNFDFLNKETVTRRMFGFLIKYQRNIHQKFCFTTLSLLWSI